MMAPEEFSRNRNTVSGASHAINTQPKPTTDDPMIATCGTPRPLMRTSCAGAWPRSASTNSIREAVYRPEFKQDSTAVSTTAFIT